MLFSKLDYNKSMYFENLSEIPALAAAYSSTIFNLEKNPNIRATYLIEPDEKDNNKIPVEAIREILTHLNSIQTSDIFVVINHAETLTPSATSALLKTLEEPKNHYHLALFTKNPNRLLDTIRSRSAIFYLKERVYLKTAPEADPKIFDLAKKLLVVSAKDLPPLADEIIKSTPKTNPNFFYQILDTTIELAEKSYYKTKNPIFLQKISGLIETKRLTSDFSANKKLQLVANLL